MSAPALGQIPKPEDAPQPLAPSEAARSFKLPSGLRMELVASEPLVREPSGVCWDEHGRLFVCELHGYNLDGQIDVDELNKTGKLDTVVRRFFVPEHVEKEAEAGTFGTVKRLIDSDGDGRLDKAEVWADRLPACFGICPARGGIIVVAAPDIIFLADRDGDGKAEVREVLFTGFPVGVLDRRMGNPQWGLDDWIYVGRAHGDATITGPHLKQPVQLPNTDFRIKADGSGIEPISGVVSGLGHTFTESGDRFVSSVGWPAHFVVPLSWHSLARNPYVATPPLTVVINALHTLDALDKLSPQLIQESLQHADPGVRRQALLLAETRTEDQHLMEAMTRLADDPEPIVRLQLASSLVPGSFYSELKLPTLARLARREADDPWMRTAILSSAGETRGSELLNELLGNPPELGQARGMLEPLCAAIAAQRNEQSFSSALVSIAAVEDRATQTACLQGIRSSFRSSAAVTLNEEARRAVKSLMASDYTDVRSLALLLVRLMRLESAAERASRLNDTQRRLSDVTLNTDARLAAIEELAGEDDASIAPALLAALPSATPRLHEAILGAVFARRDRLAALLDALEQKLIAPTALSAVQRTQLLEDKDEDVRSRAGKLLTANKSAALELFPAYAAALNKRRDPARGQQLFHKVCGQCHQAHGLGATIPVGPDLSSEFQRAEETIIRDILAPSDVISPGYMTYIVATKSGQVFIGLLASESPTSLTLKQSPQSPPTLNPQQPDNAAPDSARVNGELRVILRNEIEEMRVSSVSMMPEDLLKQLTPNDVADVISWIRQPRDRVVLLDDNQSLAAALDEGTGTAEFITSDKFSGESSLRITPPQRFSPRIKGWEFRIRETPAVGEYRYIRFAWKSPQASGAMLEFADNGHWPPADQPLRRYFAGKNLTGWQAVGIAPRPPADWTVMTRDLWQDFGDFTLTGIAPTAIAGPALFDRIELLRGLDE